MMFKNRIYKPGSKYCFWRWTFSHHVHNQPVTRLMIFRTPLLSVCIHYLNGPDPEPYEHEHNMSFFSLVLNGGYEERRKGIRRWVSSWNYFKTGVDDSHRILYTLPGTVTLCFMGRDHGESYIYPPEGKIARKEYNRKKKNEV